MTTVLVTGANRGIGLEFTRQYANDGAKVIACCRQPDNADQLKALARSNDNIEIHALDVSDFSAAAALAKDLTQMSLPEIGEAFGNRDHTTVLHACRKTQELRDADQEFARDYAQLQQILLG